jgi:hypothetical protein
MTLIVGHVVLAPENAKRVIAPGVGPRSSQRSKSGFRY